MQGSKMATRTSLRDLIKSANYQYPEELYKTVRILTLTLFPDLQLNITEDVRTGDPLLYLEGTIPVVCRNYHLAQVPIWVWISESYPFTPPIVYVLNRSREKNEYVQLDGNVLPYLEEWDKNRFEYDHDLLNLLDIMTTTALIDHSDSICIECASLYSDQCYSNIRRSQLNTYVTENGSRNSGKSSQVRSIQPSEAREPSDSVLTCTQDQSLKPSAEENVYGNMEVIRSIITRNKKGESQTVMPKQEISAATDPVQVAEEPIYMCMNSAAIQRESKHDSKRRPTSLPPVPSKTYVRSVRQNLKGRTLSICRKMPRYDINSQHPGVVYVVNNDTFYQEKYPTRMGSYHDMKRLRTTFDKHGFRMDDAQNLSKYELKEKLLEWTSDPLLNKASSCIVILMSHSEEDTFITANNEPMKLEKIISYFNGQRCPALKGKPKLFIIQTSRGNTTDTGIEVGNANIVQSDLDGHNIMDDVSAMVQQTPIATDADMVLAFSTMPGQVSWLHTIKGNWYINAFCDIIDANADVVDVMRMLVMVNNKVVTEYREDTGEIQMPSPIVTLMKDWYLTGGGPPMLQS